MALTNIHIIAIMMCLQWISEIAWIQMFPPHNPVILILKKANKIFIKYIFMSDFIH